VGLRKECGAKRRVVFMFPRDKLGGHALAFFQNSGLKLLDSHVVPELILF
jgi:hypothetical protein